MQPLATYEEVRLETRRTYELFEDKVVVRGKDFLQGDFELSIALGTLEPTCQRLWIRSHHFSIGLGMSLLSFLITPILINGLHMDPFDFTTGLFEGLFVIGILICLVTIRKVEFAQFATTAGVAVLGIARAGKDKDRFEEFVNLIAEQVRKARNKGAT